MALALGGQQTNTFKLLSRYGAQKAALTEVWRINFLKLENWTTIALAFFGTTFYEPCSFWPQEY